MRDLRDHPADGRRVLERGLAADLVQSEPFQRRALIAAGRPDGAARLLDDEAFPLRWMTCLCLHSRFGRDGFDVAALTATLKHRDLHVAARGDGARRILVTQRIEGRADHVVGVRRALRSWRRRHACRASRRSARIGPPAMMPVPAGAARRMTRPAPWRPWTSWCSVRPSRNGTRMSAALGGFRRLADGFRHLARLAVAEADATLLIADDDERGEAEAPPALHDLRDAIDVDQPVHEFAGFAIIAPIASATAAFTFSCHLVFPSLTRTRPIGPAARFDAGRIRPAWVLEREAALARALGQGLDASVIHVRSAIEHHVLDAGRDRALGDQLADRACAASMLAPVFIASRFDFSSEEADASVVPPASSMICAIDLLRRAEDRQARLPVGARLDRTPDARAATVRRPIGPSP